jgi:hypothetical protein
MKTATATPRIIASDDRGHAIIADTTVLVLSGKHDWTDERRVSMISTSKGVTLRASDGTEHATIWLGHNEARLLAQAILDATA